MRIANIRIGVVLALMAALVAPAWAQRTEVRPGFNLFSTRQDVEIGQQVAEEAERELKIVDDKQATAYIDGLGKRLAAHAPGEEYPYQFRIVNDPAINAFALPGGFIYIYRGLIEAASNEAELAGVMAHEIAHVALRHGTNQVSRAYVAQAPLAILGDLLGNGSTGAVLAQLGISFAASSVLLKYSRDAERQADIVGAQILHDSGYNPNGLATFFEKLQAEDRRRGVEFFSSHPNPDNRIAGVQDEIRKMNGPPRGARVDSREFQQFQSRVRGLR